MATNENMDTTAVAGNEDERKLFAGGLPQDAKEAQIKEHFGQFGEIETVTLKTDMPTGRCHHDQIHHNFVEKMIDPDHGPLAEELANEDDFVPNDESVIEVEDGGSSEEELDEEEEANPVNEDEITEVRCVG